MRDVILSAVTKHVPQDEPVVVAVSGGVDSMVLAKIIVDSMKWKVIIAHYNHGLRGVDSDRDCEFVKNFADRHGVEFYSEKGDVQKYCDDNKVGIEEGARILRYEFLDNLQYNHGAAALILAHHQNDSVETVLFNFMRGSGVRGLSGIKEWDEKNRHLRPMLSVDKDEIIAFAQANDISWVEDSTNTGTDYDRNWLRNDIIPQLETRRSGVKKVIARQAKYFSQLAEFMDYQVNEWLLDQNPDWMFIDEARNTCKFSINEFFRLPEIMQGEVLLKIWVMKNGNPNNFSHRVVKEFVRWATNSKNGSRHNIGPLHMVNKVNGFTNYAHF